MAARVSRIYWAGLLLLTHYFLSSASGGGGAATAATVRRQQLETRRLLKKLNKPAVKSIKGPNGDIIDCVHISQQPAFDHPLLFQYASISVNGHKYYGAMATMNVWNPYIEQIDEFTLSQLWILSGEYEDNDLNSIEAGWQVHPVNYGDNNTRLFIYYAYNETGCYNLWCDGFILTNNRIALGSSIGPISHYNGPQYEITILIWKDPVSRNWWMILNGEYVGYWPSDLFTHLADSASRIVWGGEVVNMQVNGNHTSTQMGSGHFAEEGFRKASYLRNIQIVDSSNTLRFPQQIITDTDRPSCYNLHNDQNENSPNKYFYFGGPGKNPNCP